jgi:hypothetical protein
VLWPMKKKAKLLKLEGSPLLFNLVVDVLTGMLKKASEKGRIRGILEDFIPGAS